MAAVTDLLTVASWNVREGVPVIATGQADKAIDEIVGLLSEHSVDVVGLQEVDFDDQSRSAILTAIRSRTELAHTAHRVLSGSSFDPGKYAGVAIASRYALGAAQSHIFANPKLGARLGSEFISMHDKGLISAPVLVNARELRVTSLHAFPFHLFRRQAEEPEFSSIWFDISRYLTRGVNSQIVFGDFNTTRRDLILRSPWISLQRAIIERETYMGEAIDDILFSRDLTATSITVVPNFSDHHLCLTTLSWKAVR